MNDLFERAGWRRSRLELERVHRERSLLRVLFNAIDSPFFLPITDLFGASPFLASLRRCELDLAPSFQRKEQGLAVQFLLPLFAIFGQNEPQQSCHVATSTCRVISKASWRGRLTLVLRGKGTCAMRRERSLRLIKGHTDFILLTGVAESRRDGAGGPLVGAEEFLEMALTRHLQAHLAQRASQVTLNGLLGD